MTARRQTRWWPTEGDEPDPRWSLANERTLLAYSRTSLAFLIAGLAVAGSRQVADTSLWFASMGVPLVLLGAVVAWAGRRRFLSAQLAMRTGEPLEAPVVAALLPITITGIAIAAAAAAVFELAVRS